MAYLILGLIRELEAVSLGDTWTATSPDYLADYLRYSPLDYLTPRDIAIARGLPRPPYENTIGYIYPEEARAMLERLRVATAHYLDSKEAPYAKGRYWARLRDRARAEGQLTELYINLENIEAALAEHRIDAARLMALLERALTLGEPIEATLER